MIWIIGILALVAALTSFIVNRNTRNWVDQIGMEFRHLEKRVDCLMELVRDLNKQINGEHK